MTISSFRGPHAFLSNFYLYPLAFNGLVFQCAEGAFQAAKMRDGADAMRFMDMKGPAAKALGRRLPMRDDWDSVKVETMRQIVRSKFPYGSPMADQLIGTGEAELIEGNDWGDRFWGVCGGMGQNHLGKILMGQRTQLTAANVRLMEITR